MGWKNLTMRRRKMMMMWMWSVSLKKVMRGSEKEDGYDWDSDEWEEMLEKDVKDDAEVAGFSPAGVGYGNVTEEVLNKTKRKKVSKSERKRLAREAMKKKEEVTVCARCHSLRNYGQVKNEKVENLILDFDFDRLITTRLMKPTGTADYCCGHGCGLFRF
ncbi:hypothetical protein QQ045_017594 [Rhodiola kirilowii]